MKKLLLLVLIKCIALAGYTQVIIQGKIIDRSSREPLESANIRVSGKQTTALSDMQGLFTLNVPSSGLREDSTTIIVSFVGFATKEVSLTQGTFVLIELEKGALDLKEITITPQSPTRTFNTISRIDLNLQPARSAQDILRTVPGLFIGQHQGGGKSEQIFLRGFDIDHGTDINVTVDGMPVNMVSHAHGQGYADLHFLIPELTGTVDYGKGPYFTQYGNLGTAGYVSLNTLNSLDKSTIKLEGGQFNTFRALAMIDLFSDKAKDKGTNAYIASEFLYSDGPFEVPQHFNRFNLFGKFNTMLGKKNRLSLSASTLSSDWDASGQVPQRAIDNGSISRFGYIDSTEGGYTSRTNANIELASYLSPSTTFENQF
ncbi:MAG: TonB-dependent receptor plug domain-containing protein, partial [Chitinophagaceae bacterium]|nr:TonB-dependent receptor plug domain-containing protein [Chitinophagaceae bacterium]